MGFELKAYARLNPTLLKGKTRTKLHCHSTPLSISSAEAEPYKLFQFTSHVYVNVPFTSTTSVRLNLWLEFIRERESVGILQ